MTDFLVGIFTRFVAALQEFAAWFWDGIQYLLILGLSVLMNGAALLIEALPAIDQGADLKAAFNEIPSSVWWFIEWAQIGTGLGMIGSAYAIRFLIRRLPFVG